MKIAYLILAHNTPRHLGKLIEALSSPNSVFFIHIDKKSDLSPYLYLKNDSVHFSSERMEVYWGDFSIVSATLELMQMAMNSADEFHRVVLMTGSDYPVQSSRYIEDFFSKNLQTEFIEIAEMPTSSKPTSRLVIYNCLPARKWLPRLFRRLVAHAVAPFYSRDYRSYLGNMKPYAGGQSWALTPSAVSHILSFYNSNKQVVDFFRLVDIPDESFFHTVIGNSPFCENVEECLVYADWSKGGPSPKYLSKERIREVLSFVPGAYLQGHKRDHEILFARKFHDESVDIVGLIDNHILLHEKELSNGLDAEVI